MSLAVLSIDALRCITNMLWAPPLLKLLLSGSKLLRAKLLEMPGVKSLGFDYSFPAPSAIYNMAHGFRHLSALTLMSDSSVSYVLHRPELKLGALPKTLKSICLSYPFSGLALIVPAFRDVVSEEAFIYRQYPNSPVPTKLLHDSIYSSMRVADGFQKIDPKDILCNLNDTQPQLEHLRITGVGNCEMFYGRLSASSVQSLAQFFKNLPSTLHTLDADYIDAHVLKRFLPKTVTSAMANFGPPETMKDQDWHSLLSSLESFCFSTNVLEPSIEDIVATAPSLTRFWGSLMPSALAKLPNLTSLKIPTTVTRFNVFPASLTYLSMVTLPLTCDLPPTLRTLCLATWRSIIPDDFKLAFPSSLTELRIYQAVCLTDAFVDALPPALAYLEIAGTVHEDILPFLPKSLRFFGAETFVWCGLHLPPTLTSFPSEALSTSYKRFELYSAHTSRNCRLEAPFHQFRTTTLPASLTDVPWVLDLSLVPLTHMPPKLLSLGKTYPLNPTRCAEVPRHLVQLDLPRTTNFSAAQFRLLPTSITHLSGGIVNFDTEESIDQVMAHLKATQARAFKIPESFRTSLFPSSEHIWPEIILNFRPRYLSKLPNTIDTISIALNQWTNDENDASNRVVLPPGLTHFSFINCHTNITQLRNMKFPRGFKHFSLIGKATLTPDHGEKFRLLRLIPPSTETLVITTAPCNYFCVPHLPRKLKSLIIGTTEQLEQFKTQFQEYTRILNI